MSNEIIFDTIAKQEWLEAASDPISKAIRNLFPGDAGRAINNALHGTWLGHPLHPVLTDIPVGAWTLAMIFDALDGLGASKDFRAGADFAIGFGLLGAVGSAVTGATDWSETDGRGKTIGLMHGLLNVAATSLYTASYFMRKKKKQRSAGIALSMLGFTVANAAAYLGGHLVFGEQLGVDHTATADANQPEDFHPAIAEDKLTENSPRRVQIQETAVVLVKRAGRIFALNATCPHLGGPLDEGKLVGDAIQCPWHGSELALEDGHVVNGPTTFPARCYEVRIRNGMVEIRAARKQAVTASSPGAAA